MRNRQTYTSALETRYATQAMLVMFGDKRRAEAFRLMWLTISEILSELGVTRVTEAGLVEMRAHITLIDKDFEVADAEEARTRHDVSSHKTAYCQAAPAAESFIGLGCTSCDITDNADLTIYRDALKLVTRRLATLVREMAKIARKHRDLPILGATHGQAAQPTTFGKRTCMWAAPLLRYLRKIERFIDEMPIRGLQGATGTQASFLEIFEGDEEKVLDLNLKFAERLGFRETLIATGQTYDRGLDREILNMLVEVAEQVEKIATDLRLMARSKEIVEPLLPGQVGSNAMAYKQNPMFDERACSIARLLRGYANAAGETTSKQWLERSLDDSAARRIYMAESFLSIDAILSIMAYVFRGLKVYPKMMARNLVAELPFMATEAILAAVVNSGGNRQEAHERIRVHSRVVMEEMMAEGVENDLLVRLAGDPVFASVAHQFGSILDGTRFTGMAARQVDHLLTSRAVPQLASYPEKEDDAEDPKV